MNQINVIYIYHRYFSYMEIQQLRALEAIAREGSFLAAAARLDVSQSSLSHSIATLERDLGARLLDRGRNGAKPTDAGRRVLPFARQVLASLDAIRAESDASTGLISGRAASGPSPARPWRSCPKSSPTSRAPIPMLKCSCSKSPAKARKLSRSGSAPR